MSDYAALGSGDAYTTSSDWCVHFLGQNGYFPLENERFYRRYSVPKHPEGAKPRGLFSARAEGHLSVHALKGILRTNQVPLGQVLEKADMVSKVEALVGEERRMVEERWAREAAEAYDAPWTALPRASSPPPQPPRAPSPSPPTASPSPPTARASSLSAQPPGAEDDAPAAPSSDATDVPRDDGPPLSAPPASPLKPSPAPSSHAKPSTATSYADRPGLCVVCQDEDAVLAIVDCG
ncbi:hypothetical protein EV715DRAFT_293097 [Schizophyllum commune]